MKKGKSAAAFTEGLYQGRMPQAGVHFTLDRRRINAKISKPGERKSFKRIELIDVRLYSWHLG